MCMNRKTVFDGLEFWIMLKVLSNLNETEHIGTSFKQALEHSPRKSNYIQQLRKSIYPMIIL
jgi:hypothetical protein